MHLQKAWARFFSYTLLLIGLLSFVMLAAFYNSIVNQETDRTQIVDEFVRNQRLDLIKNVVNNLFAEISMQKAELDKNPDISSDEAYGIVLSNMQKYADSQIPLGDVEIRIDALNSYSFEGDFATRVITPFFQKSDIISVNSENADYYDVIEQIVTNGEAYTLLAKSGQFERIIYARLYRPYDWIISSSVSALEIQQLSNMLLEQFGRQQERYLALFLFLCLMFTATAITVFIVLGKVFFRRADTEFKIIDEQKNVDMLTGIYNRRYFEENFDKVMGFLSRTGGELSLLIIDVDFFKLYNDNYGHEQGDVCLKKIAKTLADSLSRDADFVVRYGGEEFIVVLPGTGVQGAAKVAGKLLENVRKLRIPHKKSIAAPYVTISVGATSATPEYTHEWKDYLRKADEALYKSKKDGRDRYTYLELIAGTQNENENGGFPDEEKDV